MADPTQSHGFGAQRPSPPNNVRSPLSPGSGSGAGTPISFQPNVNRSKTKRWVEARQYSYDGGDWGSDEEEEEEEEAPPPVPRPPYASHNTGSSSELSSRRLSSHIGADDSAAADSRGRNPSVDQKTLPFVRPADLYKRMREEKAAQGEAPSPQVSSSLADDSRKLDGSGLSQTQSASPSMGLPEVKRMSGFGTDFLGSTEPSLPKDASSEPQSQFQEPPLQHKTSSGFQSVVHQAFDVPETPQSIGSVERTNSDGTSVISPIMIGRNTNEDRTPTIHEEPHETEKEATPDGPVFKPGHRRDLSLPDRDNSPSRKPQVDETPTGQTALSSVHQQLQISPESTTSPAFSQDPAMQQYTSDGQDLPAPLKFGSASGPDSYRGDIPTIVGAGTSPEDGDNDRLREEIIRSLSRETTPSADPEPSNQPPSHPPTESIPHQFEKYWGGQTGPSQEHNPKALVSGTLPDLPDRIEPHPLASRDPYADGPDLANSSSTIVDQPRKKLGRRFSWESSDTEEPEAQPQMPGSYASPPLDTPLATQEPELLAEDVPPAASETAPHDYFSSDNEGSDAPRTEKPRLSIIPPVPENISPPEQVIGPEPTPPQPQAPLNVGGSSLDESKLLGFRDILGITSVDQRIKSFEHTRDQFSTLDSGLNHWLQFMVHEHPEHADVVEQSQSMSDLPRASPSRSRFPKLTSLGNLGSTLNLNDGTPTSATHIRRPSGHLGTVMNKQNVGERGKEFLHTAGAFSGKASGAAKGLFAKGRSKFRPSGGSDKGQSTPTAPRRSFQFSVPSGSGETGKPRRNSASFGSLPIFKFGRIRPGAESATALADSALDASQTEENIRKRARVTQSGDYPLSHSVDAGVQPQSSSNGVLPQNDPSRKSNYAGEFEQEVIAALGLSPTASDQEPSTSTALGTIQTNGEKRKSTQGLSQPQKPAPIEQTAAKKPTKTTTSKSLPMVPHEPFMVPLPDSNDFGDAPSQSVPQIIAPTIRPVYDESIKAPGSPPQKDNRLAPDAVSQRQPSVSTLGPDEQHQRTSQENDLDREPPSPLDPSGKDVSGAHNTVISLERAQESGFDNPVPSAEGDNQAVEPFYSSENPSSAQILESKRKSISGLPPSIPGVQSPLRNEVSYSPGTRSSMLSFGSFGRQSGNGKGTRPSTPANGLSQTSESSSPVQNEESAIGKLKSFGRRRRASVGDLLSGIQVQGIQGQPGGQRKRALSRLSGLFSRQDAEGPGRKSSDLIRTVSQPLDKDLPSFPPANSNTEKTSSTADEKPPVLEDPSIQKPLPTEPPDSTIPPPPPPSEAKPSPRNNRQRASISLPPSTSTNSFGAGRFYSQFQSGTMNETPIGSHHTRTLSQPLPGQSRSPSPMSINEGRAMKPLSPLEELQDFQIQKLEQQKQAKHEARDPDENQEAPLGVLSEKEEQEEEEEEGDRYELSTETARCEQPQHGLNPQLSVRSRKPVGDDSTNLTPGHLAPRNIAVSNASAVSSIHPHRSEGEARMVNDPPQPVELAVTGDDSSEEIVMSPTAYPGQEWTPMHW
ncbi:hypothetical protein N7508_005392 [Penicillium antarcticum]|uniref:uncharacterized protein n=1 Tax=Penicillium antarcticum TaxID=416450 RepID=UPI00239EE3E5|nr:uncharacterized protein N7508_005392 [Penicillium antarcticum]KAJ5306377.1 hypothetical protein N7508_005392 [Penicillium antarcticum]